MKGKKAGFIFLLLCITAFLVLYPLPYYISKPGFAHELDGVVTVQEADEDRGQFFYTTVSMMKATPVTYLVEKMKNSNNMVPINQVRLEEETDEEFHVRQLQYMNQSKNHAIQAAFNKSGDIYEEVTNGVYILGVIGTAPAAEFLKAGDLLLKVDNQTISSSEMFISYVQKKSEGDQVSLQVMRGKETFSETISLTTLEETGKIGLGISLVEDKQIKPERKVTFQTDQVGGPSAGLMFALEIYNQLVPEDISNGNLIAGTGELFEDGKVGRIGGIKHKVVAASRAGAEYFIAPNDKVSPELTEKYPEIKSNAKEAAEAIEEEGLKIKLLPVESFEEALQVLENLPKK
ncbi:SepM family pheromone-processing serine protease [Mangrovibacillus cuniculi]|uniref:endopeptidase La n=1 Tax=Mangrovibacillus cuniculi TaxID=2593652 RepID=A0A7S8HF78_9BACI|nr:SepM family pheromone-processing serine protease [Mangrovibacillus cuniculi]QPC46236.1 PDZ domain-containing protein [Mangrovibacillus cuniculi]